MTVYIFGSNGMLGNYVTKYLTNNNYTVIPLTRDLYDLSLVKYNTLCTFLHSFDITSDDVVINCAGVIPQSYNMKYTNNKSYYIINTIFPIILSIYCNFNEIKMIHITTDCVFSGNDGNYNEMSEHDAFDSYGMSKSLGETIDNITIIRTSIIGHEKSIKKSLLEWTISNKNKSINGFSNHIWNGITCLQLAKIIHNVISNNLYWNGVRHIFSPTKVSKYDLINMINEIYNLNINITSIEHQSFSDKSLITNYDTNTILNIPELYDQINEQQIFEL
jgi:dTDP-4-dehydrorhamnose reductase